MHILHITISIICLKMVKKNSWKLDTTIRLLNMWRKKILFFAWNELTRSDLNRIKKIVNKIMARNYCTCGNHIDISVECIIIIGFFFKWLIYLLNHKNMNFLLCRNNTPFILTTNRKKYIKKHEIKRHEWDTINLIQRVVGALDIYIL